MNYKFTGEEVRMLKDYEKKQKDKRLSTRFVALLMMADSIEPERIARILSRSPKSIENWFRIYLTKGIDALNSFQYQPKQSYLGEDQIDRVCDWVEAENPSATKEVVGFIFEEFGVRYRTESVRKILKKRGFKFMEPKIVPGNPPSVEEQKEFIDEYFKMKEESEAGTAFLFGDGMHLVHQNVPKRYWGRPGKPMILETNTGRTRLNILGVYNAETHDFEHLTGEENCDGDRVIEFLDKVSNRYRKAPAIVIFLDNAKYFKAKIVREWLNDNPRLRLEFLPAYSPNLNLIERFWRLAKDVLVKNTYYKKYKQFRASVFRFLNNTDQYIEKLKTLMTENFQIIDYKH